ncbi:MAG: hypothetical protein AAB480_00125 [Patescibacteria group bacterium]
MAENIRNFSIIAHTRPVRALRVSNGVDHPGWKASLPTGQAA